VVDKIAELQKTYGIQEIIFVGDRGMVTRANYEPEVGALGKGQGYRRTAYDIGIDASSDSGTAEPQSYTSRHV